MRTPMSFDPRMLAWAVIALTALVLLYLLSPILVPFLLGAILAYMLDPVVERLCGRYVPRVLAVLLVLLVLGALVAGLALVVVPLLQKELRLVAERLPQLFVWVNGQLAPWLQENLGITFRLDVESLRQLASATIDQNFAKQIFGSVTAGGLALLHFFVNLLLVPIVLFYLLRDWPKLLARVDALVPRNLHARVTALAREIDAVLAEFLRGQVTVMLLMSTYYVTALWLAGLEFALPIGLLTGLLVFIPYVGAALGIGLGTLAAVMQFDSVAGVAWVWLAFGIGQAVEGTVVTPLLVGERVGLHPVAVIFALLAFGQLFGFFGVLLALPASAALLVGLRHLRKAYLAGPLYGGRP